ncbi:MAG: hypothetical protein RR555_11440 [Bacteroidales bacterium]
MYLYLLFYRNNFVPGLLVTLAGVCGVMTYGGSMITPAFWLKIIVYAVTIWFVNTLNAKTWYFYKNLGITKYRLWTVLISADFILFVLLMIWAY